MSMFDQSIFRAYDIRGTYPNQINEQVTYAAGQGFVHITKAKTVVVGRDVRSTGENLENALVQGLQDAGANVIRVGIISTEMLYFAAATLECDGGISVTASHNPANWNGLKFIGKGATPMTREVGLGEIYDFINAGHKLSEFNKGTVRDQDILEDYAAFVQKFVSPGLPHLKVVANVNFGANGKIVDAATKNLPIEFVRMNWNEDGSFPKGTPDPLLPSNREEIMHRVVTENANFGAAWDADADRCFFYDEKGRFFHGYYITALLIKHFVEQEPGSKFVCERRLTWANTAAAHAGNGEIILSRTGHGYIKKAMRDNNAIFGGETSGHYYFRDFFFCDSGLVTFMIVMSIFGKHIAEGGTVSDLLDSFMRDFPISMEELNYITPKAAEIIQAATEKYHDAEQNHEDGLTVDYPNWRFNLRMSSNEPVLRLNFEAKTTEELATRNTELRDFITSFGAELRNDHA